jgi:hypothetical protein
MKMEVLILMSHLIYISPENKGCALGCETRNCNHEKIEASEYYSTTGSY